jgi:PD-(D/E)XK endonuclease
MSRRIQFENVRQLGEWAELRFMTRATEEGLYVLKPWGDKRYDFAVDHGGAFRRVQVKSTRFKLKRFHSYVCNTRSHPARRYTLQQIDFLAAYIVPLDLWYIMPAKVVVSQARITLTPSHEGHKYEPYMEAWNLLRGERSKASAAASGR